ncbi:ABC-type lipoprotein release transport system permease subunit [Alkalibaculum bacchi]|uniref:ABC-type lipoprotein release transport system permease subunit n=1 Tax=Alkalibaculum bacchi TaxID=645887 RepID=A0A366IB19_9FIRM|nr:FtsX-like permease family protein [Alkalibaculum bacchi]RBP66053.1 ABC-type lipoprotein release transport system permease subunit [Alkalibaculum bacchi]
MKMTTRIAYENMKYHKNKNIIIGITIILVTLLLFLIPTIGKNMIDGQFAVVKEIYPTWHALYRDVDEKTVEKLPAHHNIAVHGLRSDAGYMVVNDAKIAMIYLDDEGFSLYRMKLSEGKLPEKEDEIVVSAGILKELGQEGTIGDTIMVPYQILQDGGLGLAEEREFIISGFVEDSHSNVNEKAYSAFVSKEFLKKEITEDQISYRFLFQVKGKKNALTDDMENTINSIAKQFSISENNIRINKEYLMANYVDPVIVPAITGIILIIALAGVITIFSIYYVGMTERIQEFGKLKAIGATKRQIRQIVLIEGLGVALFAIPTGLMIGTILSKTVFSGFLSYYENENSMILTMKQLLENNQFSLYHWWFYLLTISVALLTVYLSLWRPMKIASGISEIEAIRYHSPQAKHKNKRRKAKGKRKSYSNVTVPRLSYIYLFANKKNSIITIVSMGITGVFLMVVATVLSCANPRESANNSVLGQYEISIHMETGNKEHPEREWSSIIRDNPLNDRLKEKIEAIDGIKSVSSFGFVRVSAQVFEGEAEGICGVPEEYEKELVEGIIEGEATYEDLKSGDKVIVDRNLLHWYPGIQIGDTLNVTIEDGNGSRNKKVEIMAIGDYSIGFTNSNYLLMAEEGAKKLSTYNINEVYHIFATKDYDKNTEDVLKELIASSDRLQMQTWKERYDEWKSALAVTSGASYAFLGILGVICVMNMINTMIHSVHVRKKEIGMMQAIGMTDRQLVKMLHQEGLFYTMGTLVLSLGLGSILGYPVFLWARNNGMFNISDYHYPIMAAVIVSVVMIFIQLILAAILGKSVRKKSLIDKIRFSE